MPESLRSLLESKMTALAPVLHPGMAGALVSSRERLVGVDRQLYGYLHSHLIKILLREALSAEDLGGWQVTGNSKLSGQTLLEQPDLGIKMRVGKENRRVHPGGVPPAGRTRRQRAHYADDRQLVLDFPLEEPVWPAKTPINLHLLWDYGREEDGCVNYESFSLRAVHTTAPSSFGQAVPLDLSFEIKSPDTVFVHSRFDGDDADEDLFSFELDENGEVDAH
jgi:hypothetical protein